MGYRHTSLGRPSHSTLARRALEELKIQHAQLVADIPHLWSVVANVARLQLHAARLNALADEAKAGAVDASEGEMNPEHLQHGH